MKRRAQFHLAKHGGIIDRTLCGVSVGAMPRHEVTIALHDETCDECLKVREGMERRHAFGFGHSLLVGIAERA